MFGGLGKLAMLASLKDRQLSSLTLVELEGIANSFGIEVAITSELKTAMLELVRGKSLSTVSDMIQDPESIQQIASFLRGGYAELTNTEPEIALSFSRY